MITLKKTLCLTPISNRLQEFVNFYVKNFNTQIRMFFFVLLLFHVYKQYDTKIFGQQHMQCYEYYINICIKIYQWTIGAIRKWMYISKFVVKLKEFCLGKEGWTKKWNEKMLNHKIGWKTVCKLVVDILPSFFFCF